MADLSGLPFFKSRLLFFCLATTVLSRHLNNIDAIILSKHCNNFICLCLIISANKCILRRINPSLSNRKLSRISKFEQFAKDTGTALRATSSPRSSAATAGQLAMRSNVTASKYLIGRQRNQS